MWKHYKSFLLFLWGMFKGELYSFVKEWEPEDFTIAKEGGILKQLAIANRPKNGY